MQFIFTAGRYREFRGYIFANGHAVTINDDCTEQLLLKMSDFRKVEDEKTEEATHEDKPRNAEAPQEKVLKKLGRPRKVH